MKYRIDSPNVKPEGKKLISTDALLKKIAATRVELADARLALAVARKDGASKTELNDRKVGVAELARRIAVQLLRLDERRIGI